MKKVLIIIGSALGFLAILFAVYWFFIKGTIIITTNLPDSKISITSIPPSNFTQTGTNKLIAKVRRGNYQVKIERNGSVNYVQEVNPFGLQTKEVKIDLKSLPTANVLEKEVTTLDRDTEKNNLLWGGKSGKTFASLNLLTNSLQDLSRVDFGAATKVKWSPNRYLAFIWHQDGSAGLVDLKRYDLLNQEFYTWPGTIQDLAWANTNKEVAYVYKPGNGEFSLVKATPANTNMERLVFHLDKQGLNDPYLEWTKDDKDLMLADKNIFVYNFYSHELKKITESGDVMMARLSFNGKYVVYTTDQGTYIIKLNGTEKKKIGEGYDSFEWMPSGKEIMGIHDGVWKKINVVTGEITEYAYNGPVIKDVKAITTVKGKNFVYYLSGTILYSLELQPKTVVLN